MKARIYVTLKQGVLDPQGKAVLGGLKNLGFKGLEDVRIGKFIEITLDHMPLKDAQRMLRDMCEQLLANTVIEEYRFEIEMDGKER